MEIYRCVNCMGEIEKEEKTCRHCGYAVSVYTEPSNALKKEVILKGRYLTGRVLGRGGFGFTYVGYDLKQNQKVVIKEYFPGNLADRDSSGSLPWDTGIGGKRSWEVNIGNFLNGAGKITELDELTGIVRLRDAFRENQTGYIIMDFAEGIPLSEYLKQKGKMDYVSCIKLLLPVMEGLEIAHGKGLIHRDINPDHLIIQKNGKELGAKLLDFGVTADAGMGDTSKTLSIAKESYRAPEQYMEYGDVGGWSDVYAMASVIYRCITGKEISETAEHLGMTERLMKPAPVEMEGVSNKAVRKVLANALALRTEERTGTMTEFKNALMKTLPGGKGWKKAAAAALAVLAVCGIAGWMLTAKPWIAEVKEFSENADVCADVEVTELTWEKTEDENGVILTGYSGKSTGEYTGLILPEEIEGFPVTELGEDFMRENQTVERVILPDSLQKIGDSAFYACSSLQTADLPEGLTYIGEWAFAGTAVKKLTLPASLSAYASSAFYELEEVQVAEGNEVFSVKDGVLYQNGNETIRLVMVSKDGEFIVPDGVKNVASFAFHGSQAASVILPGSVKNLYNFSFAYAKKLQRVVISEGTELIGEGAFLSCVSLTDMAIPASVKTIKERAFSGCSSLRTVTISRDCQAAEDAFEPDVQILYYD